MTPKRNSRIRPGSMPYGALAACMAGVSYNTGKPVTPRHRFEVYSPIDPATGQKKFLGTLVRTSRNRGEAQQAAAEKFGAGVTVYGKDGQA
jgi:hypothetical protein